jgi:hypothetical protein
MTNAGHKPELPRLLSATIAGVAALAAIVVLLSVTR